MSRLEVLPGAGLVMRYGDIVGWSGPGATRGFVKYLSDSAQRLVSDPMAGRSLANRLEQVLGRADPEPATPFIMIGPGERTIEVVIHGRAQLWDGPRCLVPPITPGWIRTSLAQGSVLVGGPEAETPSAISGDEAVNLVSGVVRGGGFALFPATWGEASIAPVLASSGAAAGARAGASGGGAGAASGGGAGGGAGAASGASARPEPPAPRQRWVAVDLRSGESEHRSPLAIASAPVADKPDGVADGVVDGVLEGALVEGRLCPHDHLNHPQALYCPWDGAAATHRSTIVEGPRPSLGFLVVDDGTTYSLDASYVVGSDPDSDREVRAGRARPLRLVDAPDPVAPAHAEVRLAGWDVQLVDRTSPSGTYVLVPGSAQWNRVPPEVAVTLAPHTRIAVGRRVMVFESLWLN